MHERHVWLRRFLVIENGVTCTKSAAGAILTGEPDRNFLEHERTEGERLRVVPLVRSAVLKNFPAMIEHDALNLSLDREAFRDASKTIHDLLQHLRGDRGRRARAGVFGLENRSRLLEACLPAYFFLLDRLHLL